MQWTRRSPITAAAVVAAALLVGGCGGPAAEGTVGTPPPSTTLAPTSEPLPANVHYQGEGLATGTPRLPRQLTGFAGALDRLVDRNPRDFSGWVYDPADDVLDVGVATAHGGRLLTASRFGADRRIRTHPATLSRASGLRLGGLVLAAAALQDNVVAASGEPDGSALLVCLERWPSDGAVSYLGSLPVAVHLRTGCTVTVVN